MLYRCQARGDVMSIRPKYYSVKDVHALIFAGALSRTTLHKLVNRGDIPSTQYMQRRLIPSWWVERELSRLKGEQDETE